MGREYRGRVFEAGDSLALRIPSDWGFSAGEEIAFVQRTDGSFELRRAADDGPTLAELFGSFSSDFMAEGRELGDEAERDWSTPPRPRAA